MQFGRIDFPEALLDAQEKDNLVIFAGAGVSRPAPSNLPDFGTLADELADGTATREGDDPVDRFLGRLHDDLRIHERTRKRLGDPDSKPNSLHFDLLKLFDGPSTVRLVTTNFDDHFATAARESYQGKCPEMFFAPAVPIGSDFIGIVHLHGSVTKEPRRMVLTDRDFGRAYLTQGWARRFLQDLFSAHVVLFVGYSHNDPVMHYLARGLPPSSSQYTRFAFANDGKEKWEHLGICPLSYSLREGGENSHGELGNALSRWAGHVRSTPLEKRERIKGIVEKPPPPAGEDADFIESVFNDLPLTRFFVQCAETIKWLLWAANRDAFLRLFRNNAEITESDNELAWWFATKFACDHSNTALELVRRNRDVLGRPCWSYVALAIFQRIAGGQTLPALDKWVPLLIHNYPEGANGDELEHIMSECRYPENSVPALLLFNHLLRPVIRLKPIFSIKTGDPDKSPDVDVELETTGAAYWLGETWRLFFEKNLGSFANQLAVVATAHLEQATLLYRAYGKDHGWWDPLSASLSSIQAADVALRHSGLSVLVEVARGTLVWLAKNSPARASGLIGIWSSASSITLKRLAVFGVAGTESWTADEKLLWLLRRELIHAPGFKEEVLQVLAAAFRNASTQVKANVVERIAEVPSEEIDEQYHDHLIYQMLSKLNEVDPECVLVASEMENVRQRRAELVRHSDVRLDESEGLEPPQKEMLFNLADLLAKPAEEGLDELLSFEPTEPVRPERDNLLGTVQRAIQEKPAWGIELASALCKRGIWGTDLWKALIRGWNQAALNCDQWVAVLGLLSDFPEVMPAAADEAVLLLEHGIARETQPIEGPALGRGLRVGVLLWPVLASKEGQRRDGAKEWLTVAINDSAGMLMQFELRALWELRKEAGDSWRGLPDYLRDHLANIIGGTSWAAEMARVVLAAQVYTLFRLDAEWTIKRMIGLFDWEINPSRARQAWHGYLVWGKWDDDLLEYFLPSYVGAFPNVHTGLGKFRRQFCEHMAAIALFSAIDPLEDGWLLEFIRTVKAEERFMWASAVRMMLDDVPSKNKRDVWERLLRRYWGARLVGTQPELSSNEVAAMVGWSLKLQGVFAEAVELIRQSPAPEAHSHELYLSMQKSNVCRQHPVDSALLLRHLVQSQSTLPSYSDPIIEMTRELARREVDTSVLVDICEKLAYLGHPGAPNLKAFVESQRSS